MWRIWRSFRMSEGRACLGTNDGTPLLKIMDLWLWGMWYVTLCMVCISPPLLMLLQWEVKKNVLFVFPCLSTCNSSRTTKHINHHIWEFYMTLSAHSTVCYWWHRHTFHEKPIFFHAGILSVTCYVFIRTRNNTDKLIKGNKIHILCTMSVFHGMCVFKVNNFEVFIF